MAELSDLTAACIRCGFCLESCPTFRLTGDESESPRGRIYLARSFDEGLIPLDQQVKRAIDSCVGCRACETACPSGVRYGEILEQTRAAFEERMPNGALRSFLKVLTQPALLRASLGAASLLGWRRAPKFLTRKLSEQDQVADLPNPPHTSELPEFDETGLPPLRGSVSLLEGCAMAVLFPDVHDATRRLIRRAGFETHMVRGCCGALHAHSGFLAEAQRMASKIQPGSTLLTNAAGCGSWLKEQRPDLVVLDLSEFLVREGLVRALPGAPGFGDLKVTYQDACHLAHGQGVRSAPRELLRSIPGVNLVEHTDPDRCCGSGGVYNVLQPQRALAMRQEKWTAVRETGAAVMVTANPGCQTWLSQAQMEEGGPRVVHLATLLEQAFSGGETYAAGNDSPGGVL